MKSVVVKLSGKKAILLQSNDEFVCLPNRNYVLGQVVYLNGKGDIAMKRIQKVLVAAAALIFALLLGGLVYAYAAPDSYVSLDVNPGIELELNMFDRIIRVVGTNDEGMEILDNLELKNMDVNEGLELIVKQMAQEGYIISDADNSILISVYNNNEENMETVRERAYKQIENTIREMNMEALLIVVNVDENTMNQAEEMGITAGKLALITAYNSYENADRTQEELMNMSVYDILSSIEDEDDFFEDEDIKGNVDTISGASESAEPTTDIVSGASATAGPDTITGASETGGPDTVTGASIEDDDDEYDDDEYESHGNYDDHEDDDDDHEDDEHEDDDHDDDEHDDD